MVCTIVTRMPIEYVVQKSMYSPGWATRYLEDDVTKKIDPCNFFFLCLVKKKNFLPRMDFLSALLNLVVVVAISTVVVLYIHDEYFTDLHSK